MPTNMTLPRLHVLCERFARARRLGDIVLYIDRFCPVVLGDLFQALFLLRIRRRLGLALGARGFVAKIISGSIDVSGHARRTNRCRNGSRY
jgi:hypothetical protein